MGKYVADLIVGVLGGTGDQGRGLGYRLAAAGNPVIIGSRSAERAEATAAELGSGVRGMANADAARESDVVIVAVPRPVVLGETMSAWVIGSAVRTPPPRILELIVPVEIAVLLTTNWPATSCFALPLTPVRFMA